MNMILRVLFVLTVLFALLHAGELTNQCETDISCGCGADCLE